MIYTAYIIFIVYILLIYVFQESNDTPVKLLSNFFIKEEDMPVSVSDAIEKVGLVLGYNI